MTEKEKKKQIKFALKIELCRKDFWYFCHCLYPNTYKEEYQYLKDWCKYLQEFYLNGKTQDVLVLNAPPRHCKSFTLQLFVVWLIGINFLKGRKNIRVVVACYTQDVSIKFSTNVKSFIRARQSENMDYICFRYVFPMCNIKKGFDTKEEWRLEGASESTFLTTSPSSSATGFGCDVLIVDDMYKSISEYYSKSYQDILDTFMFATLKTRFEHEKKTIVGMTRWGKDDVCQRIMNETEPENLYAYKYKALQDDGTMLNKDILSFKEYNNIKKTMSEISPDAFFANYQQEFVSREGSLYKHLKTYSKEDLPLKDEEGKLYQHPVFCVADLADKGTDYLCAIFYTVFKGYYYILDVYYTQKQMSETEREFAEKILQNNCCYLLGEGNNGGELYIKNVERIYRELGGNSCSFNTFIQKMNKESRILSQVSWIESNVFLPEKWPALFPEFYVHLSDFQSEFRKNKHDDCADCITLLADCYNKLKETKPAYLSSY
jgi:predicted phage terminase large subunit-like protein